MADRRFTLWLVCGEAATDSSGGEEQWLYVTPGSCALPDVVASITSDRERHWYRIGRITCLGTLDGAIDPESDLGTALRREVPRG